MHIFLDVTRIATRIIRATPTGIDRVELNYACEILRNNPELHVVSIITTPWFTGALPTALVKDVLSRVERAWRLFEPASSDPLYATVCAHLETAIDTTVTKTRRFEGATSIELFREGMIYPLRDLTRASARLKRRVHAVEKKSAVYLHTSHTMLEKPQRFQWLSGSGIKPVFFIHDTIPIELPEFCTEGAADKHTARMKTVAERAKLLLVNSDYTANSVNSHLKSVQIEPPKNVTIPLGVDHWFADRASLSPPVKARPYALCVGTIEPRKNLPFLLAVWRRLVEEMGENTPRLVIVGRRGWENENVIDIFERSNFLAPYLVEVSGLSDAGMASLMAGATALLAPSFSEGFGLPVAECLSLGVPVIASDIPAHREVAGDYATLIDPLDGPNWLRVIKSYFKTDSVERAEAVAKTAHFKPLTWKSHVDAALEAIGKL
jgi:glycosyltransferase involved in cell wall biosynthesis